MNLKFAFNLESKNFNSLKYIIVGDNPGKNEYEQNKFFIGDSGKKLRKHFKNNQLAENFEKETLLFNKTFLSTSKTNDLNDIKEEIGSENFDRILHFSAYEIANYSNNLNLPILIFGKSKLEKGKIFNPFWIKLLELCNSDKIFVFSHPSHDNFKSEWDEHRAKEKDKSNRELLNYIGQLNTKEKIKYCG